MSLGSDRNGEDGSFEVAITVTNGFRAHCQCGALIQVANSGQSHEYEHVLAQGTSSAWAT